MMAEAKNEARLKNEAGGKEPKESCWRKKALKERAGRKND
jgi:hypothetical protein